MFRSFIVVMFAFCCGGFAFAQSEVTLDIAGVTLEMNPVEAQTIAEKKGYEIASSDGVMKGPTFEEFVEIQQKTRAEKLKLTASEAIVHRLNLTKSDSPDETIQIDFLSMPQGPVMFSVTYKNETEGLSFDDFLPLAKEKYGEVEKLGSSKKALWYNLPLQKTGRAPLEAQTLELNGRRSYIRLILKSSEAYLNFNTAVKEKKEAEAKKHKPTF